MTVQEIFTKTKSLKIALWTEGEKLKYEAKVGVLTPSLRSEIKANKAEIIKILGRKQQPVPQTLTPYPFAPVEILRAAHARGVPVSSYGWPLSYWPGDYVEELKAWREKEPIHPTEVAIGTDAAPVQTGLFEMEVAA